MKKSFYAYMSRLKHIKRWGLMRNTTDENVAEHSFFVVLVAHALCVIKNSYFSGSVDEKEVLLSALYHEASEVITGDLPTPIKYFDDDIKASYKKIEAHAQGTLINMLPYEMRPRVMPYVLEDTGDEVKKIVKAADRLCAYIKCIEEVGCGNKEFEKALKRTKEAVKAMNMSEVDYFMENFIEGFKLTLDELN